MIYIETKNKNKTIIWLFSLVWRKRLYCTFEEDYARVIQVTGWRSALIEKPISKHRERWSFIFWWYE